MFVSLKKKEFFKKIIKPNQRKKKLVFDDLEKKIIKHETFNISEFIPKIKYKINDQSALI